MSAFESLFEAHPLYFRGAQPSVPSELAAAWYAVLDEPLTSGAAPVASGADADVGSPSALFGARRGAPFNPSNISNKGRRLPMTEDTTQRERTLCWVRTGTRWLRADELDAVEREAWKQAGRVFSVVHDGVELFPDYQFINGDGQLQPRPAIRLILEALGSADDPWFIAAWFRGSNSWLVEGDGEHARIISPDRALKQGLDVQVVRAASMRLSSYVA